jgi:hypothetical protein
MFAFKKNHDHWKSLAIEGRLAFLDSLQVAEAQGSLDKPENFAPILNLGLNRLELSPADLAREEDISKAAISRWMNGQATPPTPTRKHVINWLKQKADTQVVVLRSTQGDELGKFAS